MVTTFQDNRGRTVRQFPAERVERFIVGVDLGQSHDPTAIAVLHHRREPLDQWTVDEGDRHADARQKVRETFDVRHLERLPLGTSYPDVVAHVGLLLRRPPLRDGCDLVIDETGVGKAVGDIFDTAGLKPTRVTITGGLNATWHDGGAHVPKMELVSALDARLHTGELRIAAELTEAGALADELKDFRRHVSTAGRYSYDARTGKHDDLVLAVAIALWTAVQPRASVSWGFVRGTY